MFGKYLSKEQLGKMAAQRAALGDAQVAAAQAEWPGLIAAVEAARAAGTPPADAGVFQLAVRWKELVALAVADDPEIAAGVRKMLAAEPSVLARPGFAPNMMELMAYVKAALAAGGVAWIGGNPA